jgi:cell division transport system ATP-binding protein
MKRRVIELVSGQVVRDERHGGYQTQSLPVQQREALQ